MDLSNLLTLCEKCPYSEFFWSVFSLNGENKDPKKSEYRHFSHSVENLLRYPRIMVNG